MIAALLFAATFAAVFTLGVQQINVERRHMLAAAATSPLIGLAHLVLFQVLPGPVQWFEIAAYLAGGSAGIVAGIWAHPRLAAALAGCRRAPSASAQALQQASERLGETLRLATEIADEAARCDIECHCNYERMGELTWYDTRSAAELHGPEYADGIATALRYLRLRDRIVLHPVQDHLVRFER